jgi:hypothetical protein
MAWVLVVHEVTLNPGVTEAQFERAVRAWGAHTPIAGAVWRVVKGVAGQRAGTYLFLAEYESDERRRQINVPEAQTDETRQWAAAPGDQALREAFLGLFAHTTTRYEELVAVGERGDVGPSRTAGDRVGPPVPPAEAVTDDAARRAARA